MRHPAWKLGGLFVVVACFVAPPLRAEPPTFAEVMRWVETDRAKAERTVFLGCGLTHLEIVELSTKLATAEHPGVFLLDSMAHASAIRQFLTEFEPTAVVPIGSPTEGLGRRLHCETSSTQTVSIVCESLRSGNKRRSPKELIRTLIVANPHDVFGDKPGMSSLAPWLAQQKRGLLLLTNKEGTNVADLVNDAVKLPAAHKADALLIAANLQAIPTIKRDNPLEGRDTFIEMEPLTPAGPEPVSFATGRIFHDDLAMVTLMMARPRLWQRQATPKALVVSNPGGGLPFLETFSRNTAQELKNAGYEVTSFFNSDANRPGVRAALPDATLFLWEGHHSTLVREYEAHRWTEPMRPSLVFLQSCLALTPEKAHPFLDRGAIGVIGSTSRNYSGSGGALSLAYIDAMLYDQQTLGGSLRSAKNFLLAFAQLKEKRFGADTKMSGASQRTAWSFTLWGDPTVELPRPKLPDEALTAIRHQVKSNTIIVSLPDDAHAKVITSRYQTEMLPNARLAGLISKKDDKDGHPLVPLIFQEVRLPKAPDGKTPNLRSRLPDANWAFLWDARRTTGYLLIRPRAKDTEEIRFHVDWQ